MHAHKTTVTVAADHQVVVRLPDDFPPGEAEVIIAPRPAASATLGAPLRRLRLSRRGPGRDELPQQIAQLGREQLVVPAGDTS
jgi:hypothetical protein